MIPTDYLQRPLPRRLGGLADLALDLRWSWSHAADELWAQVDPELWSTTRNPWLMLQMATTKRLRELASDSNFCRLLHDLSKAHRQARDRTTWFEQAHADSELGVAYFSMEFGLSEALPIYSGGLGILAGDYLKTASDLGVPVTGVGLLYQQGYFRQVLDAEGRQTELFPHNDPAQLPVLPVRDREGEWLRIQLELPGRRLWLRVWEAKVGRVKLYLMDSNVPMNSPSDRGITSELYGGEAEVRLQQEIVLGIGGWRVLRSLGIQVEVCHLNEGHAALAMIERAHAFAKSNNQPFAVGLTATRAGNIFTTHTPVEAAFDRFPPEMIRRYLGEYADEVGLGLDGLLTLGRQNPGDAREYLNMAYVALRGSGIVNGVSRLHGELSRRTFQPLFPRWPRSEVPVTHVTNGVHVPSWDSPASDALWSEACGKKRWLGTMDAIPEDLRKLSDETLWRYRLAESRRLVLYVRERLAQQLASTGNSPEMVDQSRHLLDPDALTLGFARRFTDYKRPNLLLTDPEHLTRILKHPERPVQLLVAGKAHPRDEAGKAMIRAWSEFIRSQDIRHQVVFLADYDMALAERMVQGVDVWINTPRRPWEACGTSGMKCLVNGGLNLSERDGWWGEAYHTGVGWAIGDGREHGDDPSWDRQEADQLYQLLEEQVIPFFYDRDANGIPRRWVAMMRKSMSELTPRFSTNRMLREYVGLYLSAAASFRSRMAEESRGAKDQHRWYLSLQKHWEEVRFGKMDVQLEDDHYSFRVTIHLGSLEPDSVSVQVYADPIPGSGMPEIHPMTRAQARPGTANAHFYSLRIPARRPMDDYTPRIVPAHDGAAVPLEANHILWYR